MENKGDYVSRFQHENALMHYGRVNKRSFLGLMIVCITMIVIVLILVLSHTKREEKLMDIIERLCPAPAITEVQDGIYQQPDS